MISFAEFLAKQEEEKKKRNPSWWEAYPEAFGRELAASVADLPNTAVDIAEFFQDTPNPLNPSGLIKTLFPDSEIAGKLRDKEEIDRAKTRDLLKPVEEFSEDLRPDFPAENFLQEVARGAGAAAPDLAAAALGGAPVALLYGGARAGGASLQEAKERGVGDLEASAKATASAVGGGLLERIGAKPVQALLKKVPPAQRRALLDRTLAAMAGEGGTEALQEGLEVGLEAGTGADVGGAGDVLKRLGLAGTVGAALGGAPGVAQGAARLSPVEISKEGVKLTPWAERNLTTRKGLPEEMFQARERQEQELQADVFLAEDRSQRYRETQKALTGGDEVATAEMRKRHNDWLEGTPEEKAAIPIEAEIAPILQEIREAGDAFTQKLLDHPDWLTDRQREVLEERKGRYLYRSYDIHDGADQQLRVVAPHLFDQTLPPTPEWEAARAATRTELSKPDMPDALVDRELRGIFDIDNEVVESSRMASSIGGAIPGVNRTPLYKRKLDLHPEIRAIMGEQFDPAVRHLKTVENVSKMITTRRMYDAIVESSGLAKDGGIGAKLFVEPELDGGPGVDVSLRQRAEQGSQVAREILNSRPLATGEGQPISGGVPPELLGLERWQMVNDVNADRNLMTALEAASNQMSWRQLMRSGDLGMQAMGGAAMAAQAAKAGNTVFRIQTQARNILSNFLDVLANGGIIPGRWTFADLGPDVPNTLGSYLDAPGIAAASAGIGKASPQRILQAADKKRRGVGDSSIDVGDMDYFFGEMLNGVNEETGALRRAATYPLRIARKSYIFGDDLAKNIQDGIEIRKLRWAFQRDVEAGKVSKDDLAEISGETIKSNLQNYDRQPEVVQAIRKIPVFGPYVAFPAAATINFKNTAKLSFQEIGIQRPDDGSALARVLNQASPESRRKLREVGAHRLGSLVAAMGAGVATAEALRQGGTHLFGSLAAKLGGQAMPELDDQDKEDLIWAAPFYQQSSELIPVYRDGTGRIYVLDFSQGDYFNNLKRPLIAAMRAGELDESAWTAAMRETFEPYYQMDVLTGAVGEVIYNKDRWGREVRDELDEPLKQFQDSLEHVSLATMGQAKDVIKMVKAIRGEGQRGGSSRDFDIATEVGAWMGVRPTIIDFEKRFENMVHATSDDLDGLAARLNDVLRLRGTVTPEMSQAALEAAHQAAEKRFHALVRGKEVALRQGVKDVTLENILQSGRLSKLEKAVVLGDLTPEEAAQEWTAPRKDKAEDYRQDKLEQKLTRWVDRHDSPPTPQQEQEERDRLSRQWGPLQ